jgi:hypothetical protein
MPKPRPFILTVVLGAVLAIAPAVPAADKVADDAKACQTALESMKGQPVTKVVDAIREWKFEGLDSWSAENPTSKDVSKHNRGKVKFSSQEYKDIFAPGGNFRVAIYNKLVGTDTSHFGEVDQYGMSAAKDAQINLEKYTVIRVVFLDDKLVHSRVWPKLEQSAFSGGTWLHR